MTLKEIQQDLFSVPNNYYLVHCISGDYALGAGIAKKFNEIYDMKHKLHQNYPIPNESRYANIGRALLVDNVFNLVTKPRYFYKPTYSSLYNALVDLKNQCEYLNINKIAMPLIGCGLDKLDWLQVKKIIECVFKELDVEILVCRIN